MIWINQMSEKKYKFITIKYDKRYGLYHGKPVYEIINNKTKNYLGSLTYYPAYGEFVFSSCEGKVFAVYCLKNIIDFMEEINEFR